jgi:methyltransferase
MVNTFVWLMAALLVAERSFELWLALRNRKIMLAAGAREMGSGHYPVVVLFHSGWLIAWVWEAWVRGPVLHPLWPLWLMLFAFGELLRYWCMYTLGTFWNTRILIIPGSRRVSSGPYRILRHPNYVGVVISLLAVPMIFNAWLTALVGTIANLLLLLLVRIPAENRALRYLEERQH